ncbi:Aspartate aminotransferase, cytoplasmic [Exophiala dermatitidis]
MIMSAASTAERFFGPESVPQAPKDPLYSLVSAYEADESKNKVDLGVGAYRDDNGRPWILPVVKKAEHLYYNDDKIDHEYLPIAGLADFNSASQRLILGADSPAIVENRVCAPFPYSPDFPLSNDQKACTFQAISGTGAVHLGGLLLAKFFPCPTPTIHVSTPSWPIHNQVFENVRLNVQWYPYFNESTKLLDFEGMMSRIKSAPRGSVILLHACAHNPTGVDPTEDQWRQIAQLMQANGLFPFFDCAYQGFATGDLTRDNFAIRHFVEQGFELLVAQSFAKNMGLYGQRVGALHFVSAPGPQAQETARRVASQLSILQRSEISSPPIYGARIASTILNDKQLFSEWERDLQTMSGRIVEMRQALQHELKVLGTPGQWDFITNQIGMFTYTGLSKEQVLELRVKWHVYMAETGRISMAGLNTGNVAYFARAVDDIVRRMGKS